MLTALEGEEGGGGGQGKEAGSVQGVCRECAGSVECGGSVKGV